MDIYILIFVTLIFEFTLIYLLYVLFVTKVDGNFGKRKSQPKKVERCYFLYYFFDKNKTIFIHSN